MSSSGLNPYASPVEETVAADPVGTTSLPSGEPIAQFSTERAGKGGGTWMLLVYPDRLVATSLDGEACVALRSALGEQVVIAPMGREAILTLRAEKVTLKLSGDDVESLRRVLGEDLQKWALQLSLHETRRSLWWGLGLCALWFLGDGGLFLGALAAAYLLAGIGRLIRGGRWLFLLRGLRAVALIVVVALDVFVFDGPWLYGLLAPLFLLGANMSFRRFAFFRPLDR